MGNHPCAPLWVVPFAIKLAVMNFQGVGAVKGVIKAAPSCIGCIERIAGIGDRYHQLGACQGGNFIIHIGGFNPNLFGLWHQIANVTKKFFVSIFVKILIPMISVPLVNFFLEIVAFFEQFYVLFRKVPIQMV